MTEVFASNNSVVFKNEFNTKKIFPFNTTLANITSGNSASVQGASEITGDFNGDGFEDKAIGVPREDVDSAIGTVNDAGAVHIIYGSSGGLSTTAVLPDQLWTQDSPGILPGPDLTEVDDRFGSSLSSGDFNGDGKDDLAIGVPAEDIHYNTPFGRDAGMVHVIYGSIEGLSTTSVRSAQAFIESILSNGVSESFDEFGASLSSGDYNGDGKDDLAIGVPAEDLETMSDTGKVHVLHGSADGLHTRPHPGAMFSQGFENVDEEEETLDRFGSSLSSGDYNGDGKDDLAIGVPDEGSALVHRTPQCDVQGVACYSVVHVIYGSSSGLSATSPVADQLWMQGVGGIDEFGEERDSFGGSLSSGDFNGDGKDDLAIGAPGENIPGDVAGDVILDVGKVHVIYGSSSGLSTSPIADQLWMQGVSGLNDVAELKDFFGDSLSSGDFNGDGKDDLAIGAPGENIASETIPDVGKVHVIYGSSSGLSTTSPLADQLWQQGQNGLDDVAEMHDSLGFTLSSGNFNGDKNNNREIDDLAIGVLYESISGEASFEGKLHTIYGSSSGLSTTSPLADQLWQQGQNGLDDVAEEGDLFG